MSEGDKFRLNEIATIEYSPRDSLVRAMAIAALNNPNIQSRGYSFACVNSDLFSRTYHMPTSEGDVTVVVRNPLIPMFSKILISGTREACDWHQGTLDELAESQELSRGEVFLRLK